MQRSAGQALRACGCEPGFLDHERPDGANVGHVVDRGERVVANGDGVTGAAAVRRLVEHDLRAAIVDARVSSRREVSPDKRPRVWRAARVAALGLSEREGPRLASEHEPVERHGGGGRIRRWFELEVATGKVIGRQVRVGCLAVAADGLEAAESSGDGTGFVSNGRDTSRKIAEGNLRRAVGRGRLGLSGRVEHVGAVVQERGLWCVRVLAVSANIGQAAETIVGAGRVRHEIDTKGSVGLRGIDGTCWCERWRWRRSHRRRGIARGWLKARLQRQAVDVRLRLNGVGPILAEPTHAVRDAADVPI